MAKKNKPHKGLQKRVRMTKTGKLKHRKSGSKHLRSHKSADRLRRLRGGGYIPSTQTRAASAMLNTRVRGKDQPRSAIKRSPSPEERRARKEAENNE